MSYPFQNFRNVWFDEISDESPVFLTGVGRSGTHFLAKLFENDKKLCAYHLDEVGNATADSFLMYAKWNDLPVDYDGFFKSRNFLIYKARQSGQRYVESNPYLVFFAKELLDYYPKAKIIHVTRNSRAVVLSHLNKGWYANYEPSLQDNAKAPFYQYDINRPNHFFGRVFPKENSEFLRWKKLTQVGKISWMWATLNLYLSESIEASNLGRYVKIDIDTFDYEAFLKLSKKINIEDKISSETFQRVKNNRPGKTKFKKYTSWGDKEEIEFLNEISRFNQES